MRLEEIAEIRTGLVLARKQAKSDNGYTYKVLTLASIEKEGTIRKELIEDFQSNSEIDPQILTKEGDIIIRLSNPYTAEYIEKEYENILLPSLVAIIRIKSEEFIPQYVQIYLNSEKTKGEIRKQANGTVISTITTKSLKEIEIPKFSIEKQQQIIGYANAFLKEKKILQKIIELKEQEYQAILNNSLKNEIL